MSGAQSRREEDDEDSDLTSVAILVEGAESRRFFMLRNVARTMTTSALQDISSMLMGL